MSVQVKLTSVKTLTNASTTSVVELSNFNFSAITSSIKEFLRTVNYVQGDSNVSIDVQTLASNALTVRNSLIVYGTQLNSGITPAVITMNSTGTLSAKSVIAEDAAEVLRLRIKVFGALPPVGLPGEVIYIVSQGERREGVYVWLNSTGWTLLSGGNGGGTAVCMQEVLISAPGITTANDGELASSTLLFFPPPLASTAFMLFVNGLYTAVGNGTKGAPSYLSNDGGITAVQHNAADSSCLLYWNPSIAGYNLDSADTLTVHYFTVDPYCSQTGYTCDTKVIESGIANTQYAYGVELISPALATGSFAVCRSPNPASNIGGEELPEGYYLPNTVLSFSLTDWSDAFPGGSIIKFTLPDTISEEDFSLVRIFNQVGTSFDDVTLDGDPTYFSDYATKTIYAETDNGLFGTFFLIKGDFAPTTTTTSSTTTTTTAGPTTTTTTTCAPNQISYVTDGKYYPTRVTFYGTPAGPFEVEFNKNGTIYSLTGMLGNQINLSWTFNVSDPTFSIIPNVVGVYTFTLPSGCTYTVTVPTGTTTTTTTTSGSTTTTTTSAPTTTTTTTAGPTTTTTTSTTTTTTLPPRVPRGGTTTTTSTSTTTTTTTP